MGRLLTVAVKNGCCDFVLPAAYPDDAFYLIVGSLARLPGSRTVTVHAEATSEPAQLKLETRAADEEWSRRMRELGERLARARRDQPGTAAYSPAQEPLRRRAFYLFCEEHDFENPSSYVTIEAELRALGRHCQVYVDCACTAVKELQPAIDDAVNTFDGEIYPRTRQELGQVLDVDRDGRFTMLFTSWLGKLSGGKVALSGFVRGSDWYRDLPAPLGNRCDMMYLNTNLKPGPYLHSVLVHEYTHAIVFSEHVFGNYLPEAPRHDEEGWLNEGLAHLAEDVHGYGWSNLDYRIAAFLSAPENYSLVVPDYYAAGSWRSPGHRGAAYLFVRWCADRYGTDIARRLIQSNLSGVANLEAATGEHFSELFRQWSVALLLSGTGLSVAPVSPLLRLDLHRPLGSQELCGPHIVDASMAGGHCEINLAGTSAAYVRLHSPAGQRSRIQIAAGPDAELQLSVIRLPR